jgi:signal transduction histidine kinase
MKPTFSTARDRVDRLAARLRAAPAAAWALTLAALATVAVLNHFSGLELSLSIFYLLPVYMAARLLGRRAGLAVAALCALSWFANDLTQPGGWDAPEELLAVNAVLRFSLLAVLAHLIARLEEQLDRARDVARLKSDLLSLVTHEFNNGLTMIGLGTTLLREDEEKVTPERRRLYETLDRNRLALAQASLNFLNDARYESGRFVPQPVGVELRHLLTTTLRRMEPLIEEKQLRVIRDFPERPAEVRADRDALTLVMTNLIGNAVKYTPAGGAITVRLEPRGAPASSILVTVEDTGIGMSREEQARLCRSFERMERARTEGKGFGIGLKVASELLHSHDARLQVVSAPGEGSRFSFELPLFLGGPDGGRGNSR